jgi:hypothetical protein
MQARPLWRPVAYIVIGIVLLVLMMGLGSFLLVWMLVEPAFDFPLYLGLWSCLVGTALVLVGLGLWNLRAVLKAI